jgi:hypothetical protein
MVPTVVDSLVARFSLIYVPLFAMGLLMFSVTISTGSIKNPTEIRHAPARPTAIFCCRLVARDPYILRNAQLAEYRGSPYVSTEKSSWPLLLKTVG